MGHGASKLVWYVQMGFKLLHSFSTSAPTTEKMLLRPFHHKHPLPQRSWRGTRSSRSRRHRHQLSDGRRQRWTQRRAEKTGSQIRAQTRQEALHASSSYDRKVDWSAHTHSHTLTHWHSVTRGLNVQRLHSDETSLRLFHLSLPESKGSVFLSHRSVRRRLWAKLTPRVVVTD